MSVCQWYAILLFLTSYQLDIFMNETLLSTIYTEIDFPAGYNWFSLMGEVL